MFACRLLVFTLDSWYFEIEKLKNDIKKNNKIKQTNLKIIINFKSYTLSFAVLFQNKKTVFDP